MCVRAYLIRVRLIFVPVQLIFACVRLIFMLVWVLYIIVYLILTVAEIDMVACGVFCADARMEMVYLRVIMAAYFINT